MVRWHAPACGPGLPRAGLRNTPASRPAPLLPLLPQRKEISDRKPGRKSSGHTYVVKFYLVDMQGLEHLAATGGWCGVGGWRPWRVVAARSHQRGVALKHNRELQS